jgi:hypothetical protein
LYSVVLGTHKVVRRLVPVSLLVLFAASLLVRGRGDLYAGALAAQLSFYGLATLGLVARGTPIGRSKLLYVPFFYCMANTAALLSLIKFLRGHRIVSWEPHRHDAPTLAAGSVSRPAA